jgi:hydrogenase nickel incorporation protein HypA/HybF
MQIIEDAARREGFHAVKTVRLEIGELAGVEPEALRFCFDAVARGGIAAGCALEIIQTPGEGWCQQCAAKTPIHQLYDPCAVCGSHQVQPVGGSEMRVRDLLVD